MADLDVVRGQEASREVRSHPDTDGRISRAGAGGCTRADVGSCNGDDGAAGLRPTSPDTAIVTRGGRAASPPTEANHQPDLGDATSEVSPSGILYGCGSGPKVMGVLPVPPAAVDSDGDCRYFSRVAMPRSAPRMVQVASEYSMMVARDVEGGVWVWGTGAGVATPTLVTSFPSPSKCVGCAAAASFAVAVLDDGSIFGIGDKAPGRALDERGSALRGVPRDKRPTRGAGPRASASPAPRVTQLSFETADHAAAVAVDASQKTVLIRTADGALWGCGDPITSGVDRPASAVGVLSQIHDSNRLPLDCVTAFSVGSIHAAAVRSDGSVWVWGNGVSGNHGLGKRIKLVKHPRRVPGFGLDDGVIAVTVGCTKGSPNPKQIHTKAGWSPGQEGPRTHVVDSSGALWIAGTSHKGQAADHLYKTLSPQIDHLCFYRVGGPAVLDPGAPKVFIGAAEYFRVNPNTAAQRLGMAKPEDFGAGGDRTTGYLTSAKIVQSTPAHIHSMALSADGRLFTWGCGSNGRCGLAAILQIQGGKKRTMKCYVHSPSAVETLDGKRVVSAAVGKWWTWAIVDE